MDIIKNEGVFRLYDRHGTLILTDERQLDRIIQGPDTPIFIDEDLGYSAERQKLNKNAEETLRTKCEQLKARGCTRMEVSYDFFFGGSVRYNYPSDETTIKAFKVIHDTAKEYGMAFGASILNPLDTGGGWIKQSEETGFTYQYLETNIKPDGSYCANMVCQKQWNNNKGPTHPIPYKVLAYAFNEERVGDTPYFYVDENAIWDISDTASYAIQEEKLQISRDGYGQCPMTISGKWENPAANRVLCVMVYRTPELDYFAPSALEFTKKVLDDHNAAGISYEGFYSDEMHIQFDWDLERHFGETEINTRYLTPSFMKVFADKYGEKYLNFPKYLIYMAYHQHDFLPGEEGKENAQHVFGKTPEAINDTWLFRNRYFELLQRTVVDLSKEAKAYAESLWGGPIMTRAHATWQESPTCDHYYHQPNAIGGFDVQDQLGEEFADVKVDSPIERRVAMEAAKVKKAKELGITRYDYTPWYQWGASIRENIAGGYDYFKWAEFLSGSGTDHAEGGNLDRNYFSEALAASFGEVNEFGQAYSACWGHPKKIAQMFNNVTAAYGNCPGIERYGFVNGVDNRETDVLMLYPIKLNNAEERFGSWMVQYGYCNYITEAKLLEYATVTEDGCLLLRGKKYRCLVALFEPFLDEKTFDLMERFLAAGGKILWMSIPALYDNTGADETSRFNKIFGIESIVAASAGEKHKGERVIFSGSFAHVKDMTIPTDFIVDFVYPCVAAEGAEVVAGLGGKTVAVSKKYDGGGQAVFAGFRLRDDQSQSLDVDVDTLFSVLLGMEAYRPGSLEVSSRLTGAKYLMNTFPNGSVAAAPHFREIYESWEGKFFREEDYDAAILESRGISEAVLELDEQIADHAIRYSGKNFLAYNLAPCGCVCGFWGEDTDGITVDGVKFTFADRKANFQFAPVPPKYLEAGLSNVVMATCWTEGTTLMVPVKGEGMPKVLACAERLFKAEIPVAHTYADGKVTFTVTPELIGKHVMIVF